MADTKTHGTATGADAKKQRTSLVEEGTELNGKVRSTCPLVIRGKVDGEVEAPAITVAQSGTLNGKAKIGQLVSEGNLSGEFEAESVSLAGKVGNNTKIRARTLEARIDDNGSTAQVTFGQCSLEVGDEPREPGRDSPRAVPGPRAKNGNKSDPPPKQKNQPASAPAK